MIKLEGNMTDIYIIRPNITTAHRDSFDLYLCIGKLVINPVCSVESSVKDVPKF